MPCKSMIAKAEQASSAQTLQTQTLTCCDFQQADVANFIAGCRASTSLLVYLSHSAQDRRPSLTRTRVRFTLAR